MTTGGISSATDACPRESDGLAYTPLPGTRDEVRDRDGSIRPHWRTFLAAADRFGLPAQNWRWAEAEQLIRENGVTYNVYGDPREVDRPWKLDPIPLVVDPAEFQAVSAGLVQRARLLEAILADVYGPQALLQGGLLPPELIFGSPAFLRPLHGVAPAGGRFLHLYAVNLGRAADGTLRVLGDRTQSPSGAGYALENRIVLSRTLPEVFRECRVQRLAHFFRTLRDTLTRIAPHNRDNPRIVLLTPGPYNETYFEHAYLARYLGYTLVEGGDLTVRDNRVFLKVLGSLQPVDVILRRLDDDFCDPLELRPESSLGVPGLVQAVRSGNVAVANALGAGVLETPALAAFLPTLCRELLGEELRLASADTWWCGDPASPARVLDNLADLVVKPTFARAGMDPIFGDRLSRDERAALIEDIRARPTEFVAQERLALSTAPVPTAQGAAPRQLVLRAFLAACDDGFAVMPGGLARVSASADAMVVSMQRGGGSKDTWLLSSGPVDTFSLLRSGDLAPEISRGGGDLPSRAADNLFWLGRYAERAEGATRLLRGIFVRLAEQSGPADAPELAVLGRALAAMCPPVEGAAPPPTPEAELMSAVFDRRRAGGLAGALSAAVRAASLVRDRISNDMWRVLAELRDAGALGSTVPAPDEGDGSGRSLGEVLDLLNRHVLTLAAFGGLAAESMTRGHGWRFLDLGRKLERAVGLLGLLRVALSRPAAHEGPVLEALLEIADSSMTYRRRYLGSLQTAAVLDLLLADETNPRSLAYQLAALHEDVEGLPRSAGAAGLTAEQRVALSALTAVRLADVQALCRRDENGRRVELEQLFERLTADLPALSDAVTRTYLSHLQPSRLFAAEPPERPPGAAEFA